MAGLPWSMPSALRPASATAQPPRRCTDTTVATRVSAGANPTPAASVGGVHERVRPGLELGHERLQSQVPVPPPETISPPTLVGREQGSEYAGGHLPGPVLGLRHQVALQPMTPRTVRPAAGGVGERTGIVGWQPQRRHADLDVDQHVGDAGGCGGRDGLRRVDAR